MNKLNNKQELMKQIQDKQKQLDECHIGKFVNQESVRNRAINLLGKQRALKFLSGITSAVSTNKKLAECTNSSIFNAALLGESLNLSPSPQLGHYYMVPFNNSDENIKEAQFQIGYKGYLQLAMRSGYYKDIDVIEIREGEYLGRDKATGKYNFEFIEDEDEREEKNIVGYMSYFEYLNGFKKVIYWSKKKMLKHANKYSKSFDLEETKKGKYLKVSYEDYLLGKFNKSDSWLYSSNWYQDFDGMAFKTMIRQLISKWGIMSTEMQQAFENDMGVINDDMKPNYIDNPTEIPQEPIQQEDIPEAQINEDNFQTESKQVDMNELLNN